MSTFPKPSGRSPTKLVLWASGCLAHDFDLPEKQLVRELRAHRSKVDRQHLTGALVAMYGTLARVELERDWTHTTDLTLGLMQRSAVVATIVWPIREQALHADTTASVDTDTWLLLIMVATVVYVRGKVAELIEWVTQVAGAIAEDTEDATGEEV